MIIGNGNIFCDIARILLKNPDQLKKTSDISEDVLKSLRNSTLKNIHGVARKGISGAAFTTKEIREISGLEDVELYVDK